MQTKRKLTLNKESLRTLSEPQLGLAAGAGFGSYYVCTPPIYIVIRDGITSDWCHGDTLSAVCSNGFCTTSA